MKAVAVAALLLAVVLPQGKGKGGAAGCGHFDLRGTLRSPAAASFEVEQVKRNGAETTTRIAITPSTQVFWTGRGTLAGPTADEHVWARGQRCGSTYTATWVLVTST